MTGFGSFISDWPSRLGSRALRRRLSSRGLGERFLDCRLSGLLEVRRGLPYELIELIEAHVDAKRLLAFMHAFLNVNLPVEPEREAKSLAAGVATPSLDRPALRSALRSPKVGTIYALRGP
jgi:hypothetical protein